MSNEHEECRAELRDIKTLLYGDPTKTTGGLAHIVSTMGATLYGTESMPGGLVKSVNDTRQEMESVKNAVWRITAIATITMTMVQVGLQILFHFWKP